MINTYYTSVLQVSMFDMCWTQHKTRFEVSVLHRLSLNLASHLCVGRNMRWHDQYILDKCFASVNVRHMLDAKQDSL